MKNSLLRSFTILTILMAQAPHVYAWGERGHDGITRVAARIVADSKNPEVAKFGAFLQKKENMLGHLSNVPDIVWRQISPEVDKFSSPSHFVDLEFLVTPGKQPTAEQLPQTVDAFIKALDKNCAKKSKDVPCVPGKTLDERLQKSGHAPFRVATLHADLIAAFKDLKALEPSKDWDKKNAAADRAILLLGILSHFVGDLSNPHHTSMDYDGWESEQGGLHSYFESEMVDSLGLDLEATVLDEAERHEPMAERFAKLPRNALNQAWDLTLDSHERLPVLVALDKKYSLLEKSTVTAAKGSDERDKREKAKRKEPKDVRNEFRNLIILRLAAGADALQRLWTDAWIEGGKPDFSFYRSYNYNVKPDFIPLRYISQTSTP